MQQITTTFEGRLTKLGSRRIQEQSIIEGDGKDQSERVVTVAVLRFTDRTNGAQMFLDGMQSAWGVQSVRNLFVPPLLWNALAMPVSVPCCVQFDETEFGATLKMIRVRRSFKKDIDEVNYDLEFEIEQEMGTKEVLALLPYYLDQKELDVESGKRAHKYYYVEVQKVAELEKIAKKFRDDMQEMCDESGHSISLSVNDDAEATFTPKEQ